MPDPIEIGRQFLDNILAMIPEDKREEARAQYSRAQDSYQAAVQDAMGDLETQRQSLQQWHSNLATWSQSRQAELDRREAALRRPANADPTHPQPAPITTPPVGTPPGTTGTGTVDMQQVQDYVAGTLDHFGKAVVLAQAELDRIRHRHYQLYGIEQPFDSETLFSHPLAKERGLTAAYDELHKDRIAAKAAEAQAAAEAKIRADERQKVIAEFGDNKTLPFPVPGDDHSPFGILARQQADGSEQYGAQAAVEYFRQLRAQGGSIPA